MLTANYKIQTFKFRAKKGIVDLRYLSVWHLMVHSPDISLNCLLQVLALVGGSKCLCLTECNIFMPKFSRSVSLRKLSDGSLHTLMMSPFGLKSSQMILHTETSKLMYNWSFLSVVCTSQHSNPVPLKFVNRTIETEGRKKKNPLPALFLSCFVGF